MRVLLSSAIVNITLRSAKSKQEVIIYRKQNGHEKLVISNYADLLKGRGIESSLYTWVNTNDTKIILNGLR